MRYRTVAAALEKRAAPAIGIANFIAAVNEFHRRLVEEKRALRRQRNEIVLRMVRRRDEHGRFLKITALRAALADVNARLHEAA